MKKIKKTREVTIDGMMTVGELDNNLHVVDFQSCEDVEIESFIGRFRVQAMHDGNLYMQELPKRFRNSPLFRLDNSSMSLGRNGMYYFLFRLPESELTALPKLLMKESGEAAEKIRSMHTKR